MNSFACCFKGMALVLLSFLFVACGDNGSSSGAEDEVPFSSENVSSSSYQLLLSSADAEGESSSSEMQTEPSSSSFVKTWDYLNPEISYEEIVDKRDSQVYKIVKIGNQWWMAENLNYRYLEPNYKVDSSSFCYNDSIQYCEKYGRLYLWSAAVDGAGLFSDNAKGCGYGEHCEPILPVRGACPEGWHLPDWDDWSELFDFLGGQGAASKALKSKMGWKDGANGLDTYGMALFPAGVRSMVDIGMYSCLDCYVEFWVSSYKDDYMSQSLSFGKEGLGFGQGTQDYAHSVRCIKDFDATDIVSSSSVSSSSNDAPESSSSHEESSSSRNNERTYTDSRDGQVYRAVKIGEMEWMAQNLNYETENSYCAYTSPDSCAKYGRYYKWADAVGKTEEECGEGHECGLVNYDYAEGICPTGWHLPSQKEWYALMNAIDGQEPTTTEKLKAKDGWSDGAEGTDDYGFSAYPDGLWYGDDDFFYENNAYFWVSTEYSADLAISARIEEDNTIWFPPEYKHFGMNVRCIRN